MMSCSMLTNAEKGLSSRVPVGQDPLQGKDMPNAYDSNQPVGPAFHPIAQSEGRDLATL